MSVSSDNLVAYSNESNDSRLLNVRVDARDGTNKLHVTDQKSEELLMDIKNAVLSITPTVYKPEDLLGEELVASGFSKMSDVSRVRSVNIYYEDVVVTGEGENEVVTEGHYISVFGRIGGVQLDENSQNNYVTDHDVASDSSNPHKDIEIFRFYPKTNLGKTKNIFNVVDLNVNGLTKVFLQNSNAKAIIGGSAFVASQY